MAEQHIQQVNHVTEGLADVPEPFRRKPHFLGALETLLAQVQDAEVMLWGLLQGSYFEQAEGDVLDDIYGQLLNEPRGVMNDTQYKAVLRVKASVLRSTGTPDELMTITRALVDALDLVYLEYPATVEIEWSRSSFTDATMRAAIVRLLKMAAPAGVKMYLVEALNTPWQFDGQWGYLGDVL